MRAPFPQPMEIDRPPLAATLAAVRPSGSGSLAGRAWRAHACGYRSPILRALQLLAASMLTACSPAPSSGAPASLPAPMLSADFDALPATGGTGALAITTQFAAPDDVPGVIGRAWRTDGFSSIAKAPLVLDAQAGFTLSFWVALESFPSANEVPVAQQVPSSLAQQATAEAGFDVFIDTYGRWGLRVSTADGALRVAAPARFPLRAWTHVVAVADPAAGTASLYQDGALVGRATLGHATSLRLASVPFQLAEPTVEATSLVFRINRIDGAYDLAEVYPRPLTAAELAQLPAPAAMADAEASLAVPASRFASDALRPRVHAMPPANWTNEPHGLVRANGAWHMFYQRTPNGPFKTQMHWGHLTSADLVNWTSLPDALWPELQTADFGYDMKGDWSGDVIVDGGKAFAFFTSVNHGDRLAASNPGISMATSTDPQLKTWTKSGPILNSSGVNDFRDPFLWQDGGTWHMLIGAALPTGGGLEHLVLRNDAQGAHWEPQSRFSDIAYRILDPGSTIWEMPLFAQLSDTTWILVANPIGGKISKYGDMPTRAVYWTGTWSDGVFHPAFKEPKDLDLVPGHLAPTAARADDGHLRAIGIVDERRDPTSQLQAGWANMFGFPRTWTLLADGQTLGQAPAPELAALRGAAAVQRDRVAIGGQPAEISRGLHAYELQLDLTGQAPLQVDVLASDDGREFTRLIFDPVAATVTVDKTHSTLSTSGEGPQLLTAACPAAAFGAMHRVRVLVDGSAVEVFINDAAAYGIRSYPTLARSTGLRLSHTGDAAAGADVRVWPLRLPAVAASK